MHPRAPTKFLFVFFFFNDTATTEIYTLSLHDALPISCAGVSEARPLSPRCRESASRRSRANALADRKSTRLNSSHGYISYAVFCLKKKKKTQTRDGGGSRQRRRVNRFDQSCVPSRISH